MTPEQIELALQKMVEVVGGESYIADAWYAAIKHDAAYGVVHYGFSSKRTDIENAEAIQVLFDAIGGDPYVIEVHSHRIEIRGGDIWSLCAVGGTRTERVLDVMYQWSVKDES